MAGEMLSALSLFVAVASCLPGKEPEGVQAWAVLPTLVTAGGAHSLGHKSQPGVA